MSAVALVWFAIGTYLLRLAGPLLSHRIELSDSGRRWLALPAVALLAALTATAALLSGDGFDSWARPAGVLVGVAAALRRLPFVLVVILAAATTAVLRLVGLP